MAWYLHPSAGPGLNLAPAHRGQCKQANSRCPLATTRWTWRRNGASCTWPSWSGRSSSGASLRGGWLRAVGGALWWRGSHPRVSHYCPERKSPPRLGNPHPGKGQATVGCRLASRPEAGGGPCASAGSLAGSPLTAGPVGVGPQVGVSSAHREQTADGGRPVRRAAEPGRRPAAVGEGEGPGRDRAEAAGRRGGAGRIPEAASPGRRVAAPPSWCAASPDCWLRAEQSRLVGTRQDTREACPRARCLDGRGEDEAQGPWGRPGSGFSAPGSHGWHFVHLEDMWGWMGRGRERSGPGSESQPTL